MRDEKHLAFIRRLPCVICHRPSGEAAHVRSGSIWWGKRPTGLAEKPDDRWTVPLCRVHHAAQHQHGDELDWWATWGIDPFRMAAALFDVTGDSEQGKAIAQGREKEAIPF